MNALIKAPLVGEIIPPGATVRAIGKTHPLNGGRIECFVSPGLTITEILMEALSDRPGMVLRRDFVVHIDGHVIEERNWSRVRVKAGATLTFTLRAQNGNLLRSALSLVVAVAAFALAGPAGSFLAGTALGTAVGLSASVAGALVSAGIVLAGSMALNALFPVRPADSNDVNSRTLNSIQGAQNQASQFGAVPVVLGKHRQSPFYAAKPYTEVIGDDQYLRLLFCLGYGPLSVSDLRIGETPLSSYSDYAVEVVEGYPTDPALTLFPSGVDEQGLTVTLSSADSWQSRLTVDDADEFSIDVAAPEGIYRVSDKGDIEGYSVTIEYRWRLVGTEAWIQTGSLTFWRATYPQRQGANLALNRGQYEIQVRKTSPDANNDKIKDKVIWTALRSYKHVSPIAFPKPLALVALRIKATNQLSGVIDTFNCMCSAVVLAWDGSSWIKSQSANPAALFRHVLQGPANARAVPDSQLDLDSLQQWFVYCEGKGFRFNQVLTAAGSVYDKLADIAAAGRAVPTWIDGKWGVIWDRPNDSIVQHFTPRNSWGFQGQRTYAQQPHGWRVNFINEENGYTTDERIVYDDGYDASNATLFEGIQFPGVTSPTLVWKHGRYHIAQSRLRPEKISLNFGWEHLVCTRGDRVRVTHDVLMVGLASGRVKSVSGQVVTFDEVLTIEAGKSYGVQFRVAEDVRFIDRSVNMAGVVSGELSSLTLAGDLSLIKRGTLFAFGETQQESANYRVQGISHQKDLIATLTLVDDAPEISLADQGAIPAYNPHVSIPADPFTFPPQDLRYLEAVEGQGDAVRVITVLSWQAPRRGRISASEIQFLDEYPNSVWQTFAVQPYPQFTAKVPLLFPGKWSFRVRFLFEDGTASAWSTLSDLTLLGLTGAPNDVQNIRGAAYVDDNISISWDEVIDYRPVRYAVRKGDSWEAGLEVGTVAHPPFAAHGNGTYLVKAYAGPDSARAYSVNAAGIEIAGSSLVTNVIATRDEKTDGWNGVYTGAVARSGTLIRTGGASDILSSPDILAETDILNKGGQGNGTYEIAPSRYIDVRRSTGCRVTITWKGTGQIASDDFLSNPDILNNPDILAASASNLVEVYPEISFAQNDVIGDVFSLDPADNPGNDIFAEPDVFSPDVSFSPWIRYEPGIYVGRYFRARMVLKTFDPQVTAICLEFNFTVDVPDRLDTWALIGGVGASLNQLTVPAAGLPIVFASNGKSFAEPFNGGPNTDDVPLIQITNTSSQSFDFEVQNLTKQGCTIVARLNGVPTDAPKTNITIQGW